MTLLRDSPYAPLLAVLRQVQETLRLVTLAAGNGTSVLLQAEQRYVLILAAICELTEEEADLIEPSLTELEIELGNVIILEAVDSPRSRLN